ncbi:MAG TPA: PQQ-dependent sugar dehydrogenase [Thermodesulfovibrionales bacterium]|nr:PQQ-dependent sugar dehydrogenase [Thermodesulfovibrionales bacterium]
MKRILLIVAFLHLIATVGSCSQIEGDKPQKIEDVFLINGDRVNVETWVKDLDVPWSLVFLSDEKALVSERPGTVRLIKNGKVREKAYATLNVAAIGEGGLMGLALHPEFPRQPYVYAMHTYEKDGRLCNRVIRLKDDGDTGTFDRVVIDNIPGGRFHDGGRIAFGPDGMLYITTGETFQADLSQDLSSLGGKILRVTPEGAVPADNPFKDSPVYSYGNRNPQGIAWQPGTGRLFESEHGPSGEFGHFANDEINVIVKGGNYGWPEVIGAPGKKPYLDPIIVWKKTTPPSGITFYKGHLLNSLRGNLFVATLKSQALIRIQFEGNGERPARIERWFARNYNEGKYGRLRDVVEGPDGALYFLTNNRDGRGHPLPGDDRIYRIVPNRVPPRQ